MKKKSVVIIGTIIVIITALYFAATYYVERKVAEKLDQKIMMSGQKVSYERVKAELLSSRISIYGIKYDDVSIDKVTMNDIYSYDKTNAIPASVNMQIKGIVAELSKVNANYRKPLDNMGFKGKIKMDLGINYNYSIDGNSLSLKSLSLNIPEMFMMDLKADLDNIKLDLKNPGSLVQVMFQYRLYKISFCEVVYKDHSFVDKMLTAVSRKNGGVQKVKGDIRKVIKLKKSTNNEQIVKDFYSGLEKFIMEPGNYVLRASPEKPVAIRTIMRSREPEDLVKIMNMTIQ